MGLGAIRGNKTTFFARTSQAHGLVEGSEIWIAGKQVGLVARVSFLPAVDSVDRILLELRVIDGHRDLIRRDSRGQITGGARLISNPVLSVTPGSQQEQPLSPGDTLRMLPQFDAERTAARAQAAMLDLPIALTELRAALRDAPETATRITSLFFTRDTTGATPTFPRMVTDLAELVSGMDSGTVGLIARNRTLAAQARQALQSLDELERLYTGDSAAPALRYARNTALLPRLDTLFADVQRLMGSVSARVSEVRGSRIDSLQGAMDRLTTSIGALKRDMRSRPLRYLVF
jgi:ABC-type transporter Mla subunit MlaD